MTQSVRGPAVLVSGASRGIGYGVARALAAQGYSVFAGARRTADMVRLERAGGGNIVPLKLEVTDPASIQAAATRLTAELGPAGVVGLINNAGIAPMSPVEQTPLEMMEEVFRVNVYGPVLVTQAFLPLLRAGRGRVINISSVNGKVSLPFMGAYSASKFALEALSDALRIELTPWDLPVIVIEPAAFNTTIRAEGLLRWQEARRDLPAADQGVYARDYEAFTRLIPNVDSTVPSVDQVADSILEALTVPEPATRYVLGDTNKFMELVSTPDRERDARLRELTGLE